jgi:hypothetical protein
MATPEIVPELAELSKPYTLPASDPYRLQTQMGAGVPGVDTQKIDVKAFGKPGSRESLQNIRQKEIDLLQQELQAKQKVAEGEQRIAEFKTAGQADITAQEAGRAKGIYQSVETFREKNPAPELAPTKDNIQSLSTLFGLIGVIGMAMGGSGKQSATASLNAMGGMMKGWQQGRADLWKKEVQEFDKNMLSWKSKLDDAMKKAEAAYKILPYNRAEAESKLNEVITSMGSDLLKEKNRVQGFVPTFKMLESLAKDADSAIKESGVERRHRESQAKPNYQFYASGDKVIAVNTKDPSDIKEVTNKELATAIKLGTKPSEKGAGAAAGQIERMTNAMTQVSGAIKAISDLPVTTTSPVFGQKEFKGLFVAPLSVLNQNMSKETSQMMAGRMVGVARNLASLETGGAATGLAGLTDSIQAGISIPAGAKLHVALDRLAEMRRIVEDASRGALASSKYTPDQKQLIKENLLIVQNAIPFTLEDVAQATIASKGKSPKVAKEDRNLTFTQYIQKYGLAKPEPIESAVQSGGETSSAETPQDATRVTGLPLKNAKGWTLHNDGKGGYAYVSPNGVDFEEAE